jgi:hypothetical protein
MSAPPFSNFVNSLLDLAVKQVELAYETTVESNKYTVIWCSYMPPVEQHKDFKHLLVAFSSSDVFLAFESGDALGAALSTAFSHLYQTHSYSQYLKDYYEH